MSNGSKSKSGSPKTVKRRDGVRRTVPKPTFDVRAMLQQPEFVNAGLVALGFLVAISAVMVLSRARSDGQPSCSLSSSSEVMTFLNRAVVTI